MQSVWQNWIKKRFQFQDSKVLGQKDVLIFIYQQGYLFIFLIFITFIAGVNYANNLILGFCFLISAVLCISFYLTFKQLHGLEVELVTEEVGQVGQKTQIHFYFKQKTSQIRYLFIEYGEYTEKVYISESNHKHSIDFHLEYRGKFHFPTFKIYSVYPFGLVRAWTYFYHQASLWVAPKAEFFESDQTQFQNSFQPDMDEYRELRNYQLGDSLQAVSWKQVARGQGLYIKVFEQHQDDHRVEIQYVQMPSQTHEQILSLMMGLVEQCEQQQLPYKLVLPQDELDFDCGEKQLLQAKRLLAQA